MKARRAFWRFVPIKLTNIPLLDVITIPLLGLVRCRSLDFMVKNLPLLDLITIAALRFGDRLHPLNTCDIYENIGFRGCLNYCNLKFEIRMG